MNFFISCALVAAAAVWPHLQAQDAKTAHSVGVQNYEEASKQVYLELDESLKELASVRESLKQEKLPLARRLSKLEGELLQARRDYQGASRLLDTRTLDLSNLQAEIKTRKDEAIYLSNLIADYMRNFESRLHITEVARYSGPLDAAKLAPENGELSGLEVFSLQAALLRVALERVDDALGGSRFRGTAVDDQSLVRRGTIVLVGPAALFVGDRRRVIGMAEARLGSVEPAALPFASPEDRAAAAQLVTDHVGSFPLDPTLGNANLVEVTQESFLEEVQQGGPVMIPIFGMAALALLVAIYKWLVLLFTPTPSAKKVNALLSAMGEDDQTQVHEQARRLRGPLGRMLAVGVENLREPQALIEEVLYECVLTARLRLQRMLPFVQICAASAPLLGLLGTVTGIINTFKLITIFGSSDVKSLSGGISEALITTKFGLIVAIPSLLLHAFLSRKAKGITDHMEKAAIAFVNQVMRMRGNKRGAPREDSESLELIPVPAVPDRDLVREQVNTILQEMLQITTEESAQADSVNSTVS